MAIITAPVTTEKVMTALGETTRENGALCRSAKINKWAKNKPVDFNSLSPLTDAQRAWSDPANGIYYGLKMANQSGHLLDLLNVTFDYIRPQGGLYSPYRQADFKGYDHNAVCSVMGSVIGQFYDLPKDVRITINVDPNNTTGIDFGQIALGTEGTAAQALVALKNLYPCILLKNNSSGRVFVRALKNFSTDAPGTLFASNAWQNGWYADLDGCAGVVRTTQAYTLCVFLVNDITTDWDVTSWVEITGTAVDAPRSIAVPDACPVVVELKHYTTGFIPRITSGSTATATSAGTFLVSYVITGDTPTTSNPASTTVTLSRKIGNTWARLDTSTQSVTSTRTVLKGYNLSDLRIEAESGDTFDMRVEVHAGSESAVQDFKLIIP